VSQAFIGEIKMFAGNFAPRNFMLCNGQTLAISPNAALFSILGTTFGGNGVSTFMLPDLQGRAPMGWGNGAGLTTRVLGETIGVEQVQLSIANMPPHTHTAAVTVNVAIGADGAIGTKTTPSNNVHAAVGATQLEKPYSSNAPTVTMGGVTASGTATIGIAGNGTPVPIAPPELAVTFIICIQGIFPSRN
jgi:microcystin-dependent protein